MLKLSFRAASVFFAPIVLTCFYISLLFGVNSLSVWHFSERVVFDVRIFVWMGIQEIGFGLLISYRRFFGGFYDAEY
jgi:hypothetical protein